MPALILYAFAAFGLAYIVGYSGISHPFRVALTPADSDRGPSALARRFVLELMECPACLGFWTGIAWGLVSPSAWAEWIEPDSLKVLIVALFTSGSNFALGRLTKLI